MSIIVLHIWGPNFKNNFGGQYIYWKYAYENWDDEDVIHSVVDYEENVIKPAKELVNERRDIKKKYLTRVQRFLWAIKLLWFITKNKHQYDILHVHMLLWGGLLIAPWARFIGKFAVYESVLEGADNPSSIKNQKFGNVMLWCLRHFSKIIAISEPLAKDYKTFEIPVIKIPNSVDTSVFSPAKSNLEKKRFRKDLDLPEQAQILLFVGSIKYRKGVDILIEMFLKMAEKRPALFLLAIGPKSLSESGSLDMGYVKDLYALLESSMMMERVKFIGMVKDKSELAKYYKIADIFVFPTRHEGLGNVVLEAASSQLPIVVTSLPEIEEIVQDKSNGLFVPRNDVNGFIEAVSSLLDDFSFAERLSKNAREYVVKKFTFDNWQSNIKKCYIDLLQ